MASYNPEDEKCWGNVMPTEILLNIFTRLSPKPLLKCREVCTRWKLIVDDMFFDDQLWHEYYKTDFRAHYKSTKVKTRPGLAWFHIYRSLSVWPKLLSAQEVREELAAAPTIVEEIKDFQILSNGVIGVHKQRSIVYYDLDTLQRSKKEPVIGEFNKYAENEFAIVTSSYHQLLFIVRKTASNPKMKTQLTLNDIRTFLLINEMVYYANLNNEIFVCDVNDEDMRITFVEKVDENIICLGFSDRIHVLTMQRNIYTIVDRQLLLSCSFDVESNLLHYVNMYNLLEGLDWRVYFQWVYILNQNIPLGSLRDIVVIRSHGDVFFVGSNWGVLRVYYAPYSSGELDLLNLEPVRQYNFMERSDESLLTMCPIVQIDVLEAEDGHKVIVGMPKKIVILNVVHDFG